MFEDIKTTEAYPRELQIRLISSTEQTQFDELMQQHHRHGSLRRIGHELHYVATHNDNWIALASFSPAALMCTARDEWIGWQRQHRTDRLRLIANNSRFLILPGHHYPNLASRILSGCRRRLTKDWQMQFCKPLVLLETYVDSDYHVGTIYRADNWIFVGHTRGYKRIAGGYSALPSESVKLVFVKPLQRDAQRILCAPQLPLVYQHEVEKMKLSVKDFRSLLEYFEDIPDFRQSQGRRHLLPSVLALISAAMLSGARGYKEIWLWCDELSQANRRHFRCYLSRGKRHVPSITVIRNAMMQVCPDQLQQHIREFSDYHFGSPCEALAIDGKVLRGSGGEDQRQTHVLNTVGHDSGYCYAKKSRHAAGEGF